METLIAYEKTNDHRYYLVKKHDGNCGWMHTDDILHASVCLRSENPKKPAFLKVLPKNNWKRNPVLKRVIDYYNAPGEHFQKLGQIRVSTIQYVFKRIQGTDQKTYIFFGDRPAWDHDDPGESLKGWIPENNSILWDNQEAVYYDKGTLNHGQRSPVPVFEQQKHLLEHLKNGSMHHIIGQEQDNSYNISSDPPKFPVIAHHGNIMQILWMNDANLCFKGWVSKQDSNYINQLESFCLIRRFRLDTFVALMGIIIDKIQSRSQVEKMIYSACEQITVNAMLENETFAEYIQRVFHIPAREMSDVLRKTPEEIYDFDKNKNARHKNHPPVSP